MSNRSCPLCFVKLSVFQILSRSNDLVCPACHAELELSRPSRLLGSFSGILAAFLAFHLASSANPATRWTWPILAAILAFGFASAFVLFIASDLVVRPKPHPHSSAFPHAHA
ncbi:MAG TPA: hypothetical protein VII25_07965 [Candidatus Acidoferrum sp.]